MWYTGRIELSPFMVTIYSTPTCPYCKLAKDHLKDKGVEFEDVDVSADSAKAQEMVKLSGQMGVPVLVVNGQVIVGWNKTAIDEALATEQTAKAA